MAVLEGEERVVLVLEAVHLAGLGYYLDRSLDPEDLAADLLQLIVKLQLLSRDGDH